VEHVLVAGVGGARDLRPVPGLDPHRLAIGLAHALAEPGLDELATRELVVLRPRPLGAAGALARRGPGHDQLATLDLDVLDPHVGAVAGDELGRAAPRAALLAHHEALGPPAAAAVRLAADHDHRRFAVELAERDLGHADREVAVA